MPQAYVQKMAKKHGMSVGEAEKIWDRAKKASNDPENFAIVTHIFQNMIGEKAKAAVLNPGKGSNLKLTMIFNAATYTGLHFATGSKFTFLDEAPGSGIWGELADVLFDADMVYGVHDCILHSLYFSPKGSSIEIFGIIINTKANKEEKKTFATIPLKGFFHNKLIKEMNLFDPAKVKRLTKG